ncbi:EamA/RhaT family transporter [Desulfopila sp. IMCC35006]|uniref:DMT family transporter n=1 Tax=Desulfopila sp. IMCC35006 TaxID=2569542 RepID=UPI0010AC6C63|nr:DMT family transporter [Desulfopila sp. IMCC35006]TKB24024.1 EamA/RhaT family transporter [Desulfopila sp. IMCC35006]
MTNLSSGPALSEVRNIGGWLAVLGSAFFFYLATVIIRWAARYVEIASAYFVFSRFLLGFIVVVATMLLRRQHLAPRRYHYLVGRTIANTVAVFCFYKAVEVGTVAEANILNMTYPLFVAIFSWFFLREQREVFSLVIVAVAFAGVWMLLSPGEINIRWANLWGLCSGITAAFAMVYLNISRRYHDSQTILFFMFGLGTVLMLLFFHDAIFWPNATELFFLLSCSVVGVLGQYLLTYGFLYVTAVNGSIISSSRILMAALLGPLLVADPQLTFGGWCGALLIFAANAALALRRS